MITTKNNLVVRADKLALAISALAFLKVLAGKIDIILKLVSAAGLILRLVGSIEAILGLISKVEYILKILEKLLKRKDVEFTTISVKIFKKCATDGTPEFGSQSVSVIKGLEAERIKEFEEIAKIRAMECKECCTAAVPEWWAVRVGADRPQLVVLYGESLPNDRTGRSRYALTIPHYKFTGSGKPSFPTYQKGSWEGILTLKDNSKIIVNAISAAEATRVLNAIKAFIDPSMLTNSTQKIGERGGVTLKTITVKPCSAKYFETGQKDTNPTSTLSL